MTTVRRLQAAAAFTAVVLAATCWQIGGVFSRNKATGLLSKHITSAENPNPGEASGLFASRPVVTFKAADGESYFAMQLRPALGTVAALPRDIIVVIDTSASQVGLPLQCSRLITEQLAKQASPKDRIAIWTVNTPEENKQLTPGLTPPGDSKIKDALGQLERVIYAAGATDLKDGMKKILSSVSTSDDRRTVIVYLGDGESVLNPLSEADRIRVSNDLVDRKVSFIPVPLGVRLNSKTIHGLTHATGGEVVRLQGADQPVETAKQLLKCIDAPIIYPTKAEFSNVVTDVLPNRLPPLRGDTPTLVAGQFRGGETIECVIEGTVNGKTVRTTIKEAATASEPSNYFLNNLVKQWRDADRSAPAILRADRGLALAYEQTRLAHDEFLTQANWALGQNKFDAAVGLFNAVRSINPNDPEAVAGVKIAERMKSGDLDRAKLIKEVKDATGGKAEIVLASTTVNQEQPTRPGTEPTTGAGLLELEKRRRAVQEQQIGQIVDDAIRQARRLVNTDPVAAYDLLKRQLGSVRDNGDLSESVRSILANRLEAALRTVEAEGAKVLLKQDIDLRTRIAVESRRSAAIARSSEEERIRQRVKIIGEQMDRARYEEAYHEALELQRELIAKGRTVPPAVNAAYVMGTNAAAIRDYEELRRVNEERFLLTMMLVDKSGVPFPDEPPVAFPAAAFWKEITALRKDRYEQDSLGGFSRKTLELKNKLSRPVTTDRSFDGVPLKDFLDFFADRHEMTILINPVPFKEAMGDAKIEEQTVRIPKMPGVSLSTLLSYALSQVNATYIIRRDYIEITTKKAAGYEKTVKAYPVADLVIPIPNAVDPASLNQNLQLLGSSLSANGQAIFGAAGGGLNFGNFGVFGGAGFVPGGIGGGFGQLGAAGGGQQAFLGGNAGQQGGALGFAGGNNQTNLGIGGGVLGFGGGQQGQFGNLGGQFGIQGGDTSNILIQLIQDTIAPKEWNTRAALYLQQNTLEPEQDGPPLDISLLNSLGYYQPARALVVRASGKVHSRIGEFSSPTAPMGAANNPDRGGDVIVFGPKKNKDAPAVASAPANKPEPAKKPDVEVVKNPDRDPKKVWQDHMAQGHFKPRQVIATVEVLSCCHKFDEVVELLKADLRHGVLTHACVYDALATALEGSGASIEEVERVRLSKIDLDPENADNFIDVARSLADMGRHDRALEYCKRASALELNSVEPYRQALNMTNKAGAAGNDTVIWAAGNLLEREWGAEAPVYHQMAKSALEQVAMKLEADGRKPEADRIRLTYKRNRERDLVIELVWADQADLDLTVAEPVGTVCSVRTPRTPAGGHWTGDRLGNTTENYVAAKAFNGSYEVKVHRVWGESMGNKATVKVIKHQGTPNESVEFHTVMFDSNGDAIVKVQMADGRRTESESVPVEATVKRLPVNRGQTQDEIYSMLRSMSDPMLAAARPGMKAGSSATGSLNNTARSQLRMESGVELSHQTKVSPALTSGIDLLTSTTISPDRLTMKVSLTPTFEAGMVHPRVPISAVPGGK